MTDVTSQNTSNGILLIDKPLGWTSFDVVAKVRNTLNQAPPQNAIGGTHPAAKQPPRRRIRVGHAGTLDPLATGLLVLLIGDYCKRASEFSGLDKTYQTTIRLGQNSTTDDEEGEKTPFSDRIPDSRQIKEVLDRFVGTIEQVPPAFSAIKVGGRRAYKIARAGQTPHLQPRKTTIYSIDSLEYQYPQLSFVTRVSSGTYIRSLARDIGQELATGGYLSRLKRTTVGDFNVEDAHNIQKISPTTVSDKILRPS